MIYANDKEKIKIDIAESVLNTMSSYAQRSFFDNEKGGILIGEIKCPNEDFIILDLTCPYPTDNSLPIRFIRKEAGHQEYMDNIWNLSGQTKTYLGEWHTHYEKTPNPSFIDKRNWFKISQRKHNSDCLVFIIVGYKDIRIWMSKRDRTFELMVYGCEVQV